MRWRKGVQDKQPLDGVSPHFNQMYQIANICWIIEEPKEFRKNISFIDYTKAFDCVNHKKLWKILQEMNTRPPDLPLRNLYADQEATVIMGLGTMDRFNIGKGICQGFIVTLHI